VGTGLLDSGLVEGSLLPDIQLLDVAVQRYGHFFHQAENVVIASQDDGLRLLLIDAASPGSVVINALPNQQATTHRVDINLMKPQAYETNATLDLLISDGDDPMLKMGFINGPTVQMTADVAAVGGNGWQARGYLGGNLLWEVAGSGPAIGEAEYWPTRARMGLAGPEILWSLPVQISGLSGAVGKIDMLELIPVDPTLPLPGGDQMELSFTGMVGLAFGDDAALSPVPVVGKVATELLPNVPNPFNPVTDIRFTLARSGHVSIKVYDLRGRLVRTLLDASHAAGPGSVIWDGKDNRGATVAAGVYHALMKTADGNQSRKLVLIK